MEVTTASATHCSTHILSAGVADTPKDAADAGDVADTGDVNDMVFAVVSVTAEVVSEIISSSTPPTVSPVALTGTGAPPSI